LFKLGRELQQKLLVTKTPDELYSDWQIVGRPMQWDGDGRLTCGILQRGKWRIAYERLIALSSILHPNIELADPGRRPAQYRGKPDVVLLVPKGNASCGGPEARPNPSDTARRLRYGRTGKVTAKATA